MAYTTKADLPPEYRMALECTHDSPEAELAWTEHVFACANTNLPGLPAPARRQRSTRGRAVRRLLGARLRPGLSGR